MGDTGEGKKFWNLLAQRHIGERLKINAVSLRLFMK